MGSNLVTHIHPCVCPLHRTHCESCHSSVQKSSWPPSPVQSSQGQHARACPASQIMKDFHGNDTAESLLTEGMANVTVRAQATGWEGQMGGQPLLSERFLRWIEGSSGELWKKGIPRCALPTPGWQLPPHVGLGENYSLTGVEEGKITWLNKAFLCASSGDLCFLCCVCPLGSAGGGGAEKQQRGSGSGNSPVSESSQSSLTATH